MSITTFCSNDISEDLKHLCTRENAYIDGKLVELSDSEVTFLVICGDSYDIDLDIKYDRVLNSTSADYKLYKEATDWNNIDVTEDVKDNLLVEKEGCKIDVNRVLNYPIVVDSEIRGGIIVVEYNEKSIDIVSRIEKDYFFWKCVIERECMKLKYKELCMDNYGSCDIFLANVSHEIRTPLNGIVGYGQLIGGTELNQAQRSYVNCMNQCSIQLMQIINDLLDFTKLSSGKMKVQKDCFSFNDLINSVEIIIGQKLKEKRQSLMIDVKEDVPDFIVSDKQKIIQILVNLVSNASKFSDLDSSIYLTFTVRDRELIGSVRDEGVGISQMDQVRLFQTFSRIDKIGTGTGLGLTIVKKLCELLEGDIEVTSRKGYGSEFTFRLKFEHDSTVILNKELINEYLRNRLVLVVDDNADNRILISEMLEEKDMKPIAVGTALEAMRMILNGRYSFSVCLIDICMPGTSGVELAKLIKEERPFLPLIALSSLDSFVNTSEFEHKLDKPLHKVQLYTTMCNVIQKSKIPESYVGVDKNLYSEKKMNSMSVNKDIKILVAEDIEYNRKLVVGILENLGYSNVYEAKNGGETFNYLKREQDGTDPFEVLILDIRMPLMNGYDVLKKIQERKWRIPKTIVVTASVMDEDKENCISAGAEYFMAKPVSMNELKNTLLIIHRELNQLRLA